MPLATFLPNTTFQLSTTTNSSITPSSGVHLNHGRLCTVLRCELWCELWCELLVLSALMCCEDDAVDGNRVPSVGVSDMVYTCQAFLYRWWCCVLHETGARAARVDACECTELYRLEQMLYATDVKYCFVCYLKVEWWCTRTIAL